MDTQNRIVQSCLEEIRRRKAKNPSYSMRAFSRDLGVSPSYMSKILTLKVPVSDKFIVRVQKLLKEKIVNDFEPLALQAVDDLVSE